MLTYLTQHERHSRAVLLHGFSSKTLFNFAKQHNINFQEKRRFARHLKLLYHKSQNS